MKAYEQIYNNIFENSSIQLEKCTTKGTQKRKCE